MPERSIPELRCNYQVIIDDDSQSLFMHELAKRQLAKLDGTEYRMNWEALDTEQRQRREEAQREAAHKIIGKRMAGQQRYAARERMRLGLAAQSSQAARPQQDATGASRSEKIAQAASERAQKTARKRSEAVAALLERSKQGGQPEQPSDVLARLKAESAKDGQQQLFDRAKEIAKRDAEHDPNRLMQDDDIPF